MVYFDIHSHHFEANQEIVQIMNVMPNENIDLNLFRYMSCGLHPWYINQSLNFNELELWLKQMGQDSKMVALGECGLDKMRGPELDLQKNVFLLHVKISETIAKPIIIHCVKGINEIMQFRKQLRPNQPWILHGFNGSEEMIDQCAKLGFYFSLNEKCLSKANFSEWIGTFPLDRIFLESDDTHQSVALLYQQISHTLSLDVNSLVGIIDQNVKKVFGIE